MTRPTDRRSDQANDKDRSYHFCLASNDLKADVYIPTGGVRIGANLGVGLLNKLLKLRLGNGLVFDVHLNGEAIATAIAEIATIA